jgi:N-acetylglucosamine-6-sulfatase
VPAATAEITSDASRSALEHRASPEIAAEFGTDFLDPLTSEETIRRRAEMLLSIDEGLGRIFASLEARGTLDQTVIVFTSDNGYFFGEHGFSIERRMPYDESIRSPLLVRYPPRIPAGQLVDELALSIDLAPTLLDFGQAPIGNHIQGRSLVPLLTGESPPWRESILIEFFTYENPMPWLVHMDYRAVRTHRYKYIHWLRHRPELYDIVADPWEMTNLIEQPAMREVAVELRRELGRLSLEALDLDVAAR